MRNINDIIRNLILLGLSLVILEPVISTEVLDAVSAWRGPERRRPEPTFLCDVSKEAAPDKRLWESVCPNLRNQPKS